MRLISSEVALRIVMALEYAGNITRSALSRAVEAPTSSTRRALEILAADGFVAKSGHTFRLAGSSPAEILARLAEELLGAEEVIRVAATRRIRWNSSVATRASCWWCSGAPATR